MTTFGRRTAVPSRRTSRVRSSDASDSIAAASDGGDGESDRVSRPVRTDGGRNRQGQDRLSDERSDGDDDGDAVTVEFLDRETVRIVGDLEETILSLFWWDESGLVGTITEPIGGVDGERVVTVSEAFADQEFAHGPIVSGVEGFANPGPSVPGTGDVAASNPDRESHVEGVREEYDGPGELEEPFPDAS